MFLRFLLILNDVIYHKHVSLKLWEYFIKQQCISSIWKDHFLSYLSWNHLRCQNILIESYEPDVSSAVFVYKQFSDAWNIIYKEAKRSDHQPRQTVLLWLIRFCYNFCRFGIMYLEELIFFLWRVLSHQIKHSFFSKMLVILM